MAEERRPLMVGRTNLGKEIGEKGKKKKKRERESIVVGNRLWRQLAAADK